MRRPEIIQFIKKEAKYFNVINKSIIDQFFRDFTNHRKKTNREAVYYWRPLLNILKYRNPK